MNFDGEGALTPAARYARTVGIVNAHWQSGGNGTA
jgi:hypothetical protein